MIIKTDLDSCRQDMQAYIGKKVTLKSNGGRKRLIVQEGILESCYPNVFTVRCAKSNVYSEMVSYSYVDILTHTVEIDVGNGTRFEVVGH